MAARSDTASTGKYCRTIWQCNSKFKGSEECFTPHLNKKDLRQIFLEFVNSLITDHRDITRGLKEALMSIANNAALERERDAFQDE